MKPKHQRLTLALAALATVIGAGLLAVSALSDRAAYFYSPADLAKAKPAPDAAIRLGGMVADKSIVHEADGVTIRFVVEDGAYTTPVRFKGIVPEVLRPGKYRINPFAYGVQTPLPDAITIRPGFGGVVTALTGLDVLNAEVP